LSFETVCGACENKYRQAGAIFEYENDAFEWLETGKMVNEEDLIYRLRLRAEIRRQIPPVSLCRKVKQTALLIYLKKLRMKLKG
jgi:hypothetical protein